MVYSQSEILPGFFSAMTFPLTLLGLQLPLAASPSEPLLGCEKLTATKMPLTRWPVLLHGGMCSRRERLSPTLCQGLWWQLFKQLLNCDPVVN